ncbi:synaptic vesicle transporter [Phyllosticta citribraziliensis]
MGLGILESRRMDRVPGTVLLEDEQKNQSNLIIDPNLKYDRSGPVPVILVPQPSDDPNDPLASNWPLWWRDIILFILSLVSVIAATLSSLLAANTLTLSLYFGRDFTDMALLTGYHLLGVGLAGFMFVPSARVWGKRHAFLIGSVIVVLSSAWGGASGTSYKSLLWARIFQGIGLAPFEALVNACVGDLYYVHERGKRMALSNMALFGGAFFTPVIVGKMTETIGWEWSFYCVAIISGALLPAVIFLCPETAYVRSNKLNTDFAQSSANESRTGGIGLGEETGHELEAPSLRVEQDSDRKDSLSRSREDTASMDKGNAPSEHDYHHIAAAPPAPDAVSAEAGASPRFPPKATYLSTLRPFNGRKSDDSFIKLLLRPFPLFLHPGILWSCLIQGVLIGWTVMIGVVLAAVMLGPPLFFTEVQTGYMYTGAFIGALAGFGLAGVLADSVPRAMARANKGVYEPEFRTVLVVPQFVLGCAGLYGFGIVSEDTPRYGWFWPDFFFALVVAGMVIGAVASALYVVDAHRELAVEAFTAQMVFKNIFCFALTWKAYDWLVAAGVKPVFTAVASVQVVVCATTILMYVFGKRNRAFFARHDVLKMLHLW